MRLGVLGDVHGNAAALAAVLEDARAQRVELLLITGDLVGYYYRPDEVVRMLEGWSCELVQGNHEALLGIAMKDGAVREAYRARYGHGLEMALARLRPQTLIYLSALPLRRDLTIGSRRVILCHGAPWNPEAYIYPDAPPEDLQRCADEGADVVCMGHTHYPMARMVGPSLLLNPGAVGQPRDGDPRASWARLELPTLAVELRRVPYPAERVAAEARQLDPAVPYLADVLLQNVRINVLEPGTSS